MKTAKQRGEEGFEKWYATLPENLEGHEIYELTKAAYMAAYSSEGIREGHKIVKGKDLNMGDKFWNFITQDFSTVDKSFFERIKIDNPDHIFLVRLPSNENRE